MIRILRLIQELRTIVTSIMGSLKSLLWTVVLLFMLIYVFAVLLTQQVLDHRVSIISDEEHPFDEKLASSFGSLGVSILTLYQAISSGLNWETLAEPLMERIGVTMGFILATYTALIILVLMNVVTGVFVESAMQTAKDDRTSYMLEHVKHLFQEADPEGTGSIDWERFQLCLDKQFMLEFFQAIDVDVSDAQSVFALLDTDDSGEVDLDEFLNGCLGLHGPSQAIHLAALTHESRIGQRYQHMHLNHLGKLLHQVLQAVTSENDMGSICTTGPAFDASVLCRRAFAPSVMVNAASDVPMKPGPRAMSRINSSSSTGPDIKVTSTSSAKQRQSRLVLDENGEIAQAGSKEAVETKRRTSVLL